MKKLVYLKLHDSEAWVLQFAKRTRTGYSAGTGTRMVLVLYAPMMYQFLFLNLGTVTVRRWYSQGTHNGFFLEKMRLFTKY
jgi:hypothetical protein